MRSLAATCIAVALSCHSVPAVAQIPGTPADPPAAQPAQAPTPYKFTPFVRNWTRVESWSFFEPPPGGADPDYTTIANRLYAGVRHSGPRHEVIGAVQYVQFGGLPDDAIGPGPLGTGATYYQHNQRSDSRGVYLRMLNLQVKQVVPRVDVRGGRMGYASGAEAPSGDASIEAVKRLRLDSRLVGEFEWSMYQRAFDGARVDWTPGGVHATFAALWPTQGGFEEHAGASLRDVRVLGGAVTTKPSQPLQKTELQAFAFHYRDTRPVTSVPDNTGRTAAAADVSIMTFGASSVTAYPIRSGRVDALMWVALQLGDWYDDPHSGLAFALEGGHQWTAWAGRPWVRGGWNHASGDDDPSDDDHETFFPVLPTIRKYSQSATYSTMNLDDVFVQVVARPHERVGVRGDVHWLRLSENADLWYVGSGATRRTGSIFGYAGRRSGGEHWLGTAVEGSADWTITPRWSLNGYLGWIAGGDVVRASFARDRLTFFYFENVLQF